MQYRGVLGSVLDPGWCGTEHGGVHGVPAWRADRSRASRLSVVVSATTTEAALSWISLVVDVTVWGWIAGTAFYLRGMHRSLLAAVESTEKLLRANRQLREDYRRLLLLSMGGTPVGERPRKCE